MSNLFVWYYLTFIYSFVALNHLMLLLKTINHYKEWYQNLEDKNSIGFVPTMGALHKGHYSLIEKSVNENKVTIVSIFVNPTQFNNPIDLKNYPSCLERDLDFLRSSGTTAIFAPSVSEMYPNGTENLLNIDLLHIDKVMEGKFRPGHFNGVVTVVNNLFEIVKPNNAYFGEKDFQQYMVIKRLCELKFPKINIIPSETIREDDGLAFSSRNALLKNETRIKAKLLFNTLQNAADLFKKMSADELNKWVEKTINSVDGFHFEYFEIFDEQNLLPLSNSTKQARAFIAVYVDGIRLIDNFKFKP